MPHPSIQNVCITAVGRLLGVDQALAYRNATQGKYGQLTKGPRNSWLLSVAEIERRLGRTFTPEQIENAVKPSAAPKLRIPPAPRALRYTRNDLEHAITAALDERDREWSRWMSDRTERALSPGAPRRNQSRSTL